MEEIICPQCGRPNLIEAEKCWYCQTVLEKNTGESQEKTSVVLKAAGEEVEKKLVPEDEMRTDQNIPEWLKRIRELKEVDQPHPEEKDPNWHQQDLFESGEKPQKQKVRGKKQSSLKKKTAHHYSKRKKKDDQLLETKQKKRPKQTKDADIQKNDAMEKPDKDSETLPDELPEGFTKL
jgi:hypothetical protein